MQSVGRQNNFFFRFLGLAFWKEKHFFSVNKEEKLVIVLVVCLFLSSQNTRPSVKNITKFKLSGIIFVLFYNNLGFFVW